MDSICNQSTSAVETEGNILTTDEDAVKWGKLQSVFGSGIRTGVIVNLKHKDVSEFLNNTAVLLQRYIKKDLEDGKSFKTIATLCAEFLHERSGDVESKMIAHLESMNCWMYQYANFMKCFDINIKQPLLTKIEDFQKQGSGFRLLRIINLTININEFVRLPGSSSLESSKNNKKARREEMSYLKLPKTIEDKKACVNVKNSDDASFAWSVVAGLYPPDASKNIGRISSYPHCSQKLNLQGIMMPMTINQIPVFEIDNSISVNVFKLIKGNEIATLYTTERRQSKHVNLLRIQDKYDDGENNSEDDADDPSIKYHYVYIKNTSRLLSSTLNKSEHKQYICDRCLNNFYSQEHLDKHVVNCQEAVTCDVTCNVPKDPTVKFKNFINKMMLPFVIYADLECILKPCNDRNIIQEHCPCSIGYYVKCSFDDKLSFYDAHRGENCLKFFTTKLQEFAKRFPEYCPNLPITSLTESQLRQHYEAKKCHICNKSFQPQDVKVRDHCHFSGKYRGPAHKNCNLYFKQRSVIPVVFHNLSGYDSHFIISNLALDFDGDIDIIPESKEKYISITKKVGKTAIQFRFIDSFRFMGAGLDKLASNLVTYPILKSEFKNVPEDNFPLLTRKGVYPYDYIDSFERFMEITLPPLETFYSKLNDSHISDDDYAHAKSVWERFKINNLGEYSDLYLKTDVLLLADIFEQFRSAMMKSHELDPANYYSTPGYTWDAMLKYTGVELQLLTNNDQILFVESGIRGGLSQCSKRYAKANNKYMHDYDATQPSTYLLYADVNNLYGWAMSESLPKGEFMWVEDVENFNIHNIPTDSSEGYILEVDLEYPVNVHNDHSDLPFCPERVTTEYNQRKLMATLNNKSCYVVHYRKLMQALKHGLILTKIHRILKFKQEPWLKSYIELNTRLRTDAKNDFEKDLYKLLNNAVFGKTMENVRHYRKIKLLTKWEGNYGIKKLIKKPNFKSCTIFCENLVAMEFKQTKILFSKPICVGMSVLDISKTKVYEFHYEYMRPKFGNKCKVCYTDTDSLIYETECEDFYEVVKQDCKEYFDTSDYPENNVYEIPRVNKKVPGKMKDELNGKIMTEFVGLRSKCYAYRVEGVDKDKKAKGVKKNVVKNNITFEDYVECLQNSIKKRVQQNLIRSKKHEVHTVTQWKIALNPHDDKRYLKPDSYETLPWGHHEINNNNISDDEC